MRLLIALPLLILLVLFALSNTAPVTLGLWPTGYALQVPLSLAMLAGMAGAFFLGGLVVWLAERRTHRRARRAEHTVRLLEAQVQTLQASAPHPPLPPIG